jgi:hypothetical protein
MWICELERWDLWALLSSIKWDITYKVSFFLPEHIRYLIGKICSLIYFAQYNLSWSCCYRGFTVYYYYIIIDIVRDHANPDPGFAGRHSPS